MLKKDVFHIISFNEFCPCLYGIRKKRKHWPLLLCSSTPEGTITAEVFLACSVLWHRLHTIAKQFRPLAKELVVLTVCDMSCRNTHAVADTVQRVLEFRRCKEWESSISPFFSDVDLSL